MKSGKGGGIFADWGIKLLCFILAVVTVYVIQFGLSQKRTIKLPLNIIMPETYKAVSIIPQSVDLVIQGTEDRIYMINADEISVYADFSSVNHNGVASVPVRIDLQSPTGLIDLSQITLYTNPSSVKIYFEKTGL